MAASLESQNERIAVRSKVHIACAFNDAYAPHFATLATSLAATRGTESLQISLIVGPCLTSDVINQLERYLAMLNISMELVRISKDTIKSLPSSAAYPSLVWFRLLLPDLLPNCSRVLYLDTDTLVLQSLLPLFQEDLGTNLIGAVASPTTGWEAHCERFGIDPKQGYFNSGVLLMNLDLMRCENFTARALQLAADKNKILQFPDQDVLNISTIGRWRKLHPKWNAISYLWLAPQVSDRAYSALEYSLAKHSPGIVHFEGPATVKPWYFRSMHPMRQLYLQFRAQTPWPLQELEGRTLKALGLRMLPLKCQHQLTRFKIMVRDFFSARP